MKLSGRLESKSPNSNWGGGENRPPSDGFEVRQGHTSADGDVSPPRESDRLRVKLLPTTRIAVRRLFGGPAESWIRAALVRDAETAAGDGSGSAVVLIRILERHGDRLTESESLAIGEALAADIPMVLDGLAREVLAAFETGGVA